MAKIAFRIEPKGTGGLLGAALEGFARPIAAAATQAVILAGDTTKAEGRARIAGEGFGNKWVNSFRAKYYPRGVEKKPQISVAAFIYHKIPYAGVFEKPTTVPGNPLLWIPIQGAFKSLRIKTPKQMEAQGVKLFSMAGTEPPLLGAKIKGSKRSKPRNVSLAKLKRGTTGKRGVEQTVALFKGLSTVKLRKAFNIQGVADKQRAAVPGYYNAALNPDER